MREDGDGWFALELDEYLAIAAEVTGLTAQALEGLPGLGQAESALAAPSAGGFGGPYLYQHPAEKLAVLLFRLIGNHPLPDGNKRTAWVTARLTAEANGVRLLSDMTDHVVDTLLAVAAGQMGLSDLAAWLDRRLVPIQAVQVEAYIIIGEKPPEAGP